MSVTRVILESPLAIPDIREIYHRIEMVVPSPLEITHLALLDAQGLSTTLGKSPLEAVVDICEQLDMRVIEEYTALTNMNRADVHVRFENDVYQFVTQTSNFYKSQLKFISLSKHLLHNGKYLMAEEIINDDIRPHYVVAIIKELSYVQLSKCNNSNFLSFG